jgi:DNA helicase-2/ATP-dependent DNA helicase PcrA
MLFGSTNYNPPSRFLKEIPVNLIEKAEKRARTGPGETTWSSRSTVGANDVGPGDRVRHDKWGVGTITEVIGSGDRAEAWVAFDREGRKRLLLAWAPLEKV